MNKVRVIGATVSKDGVTLYLEDGRQHALRKDSYQTKKILDDITAELARHKVVEVDLESLSIEKAIEKKSGGFIRFVREKLVNKVTELFRPGRTVEKVSQVWVPHEDQETSALGKASDKHLVDEKPAAPTERVVAIVGDKRVEGVEAIARQAERAAYGENFEGFKAFLERMAKVSAVRKHTVTELLNFMRRADLPIADDGSIIAYKVLRRRGDGRYADCHTGKVSQTIGSRVSMDEKLVDQDRRHECSTGLHIARRGYLGNFGGDVVTMVKIAPEDVIAVPFHEPDKMRVAAYHILFEITEEGYALLKANKPMTTVETDSRRLGDAIAGRHVRVLEEVVIGGGHGTNVTIRKVDDGTPELPPIAEAKAVPALDDSKTVVDTKALRQVVDEVEREVQQDDEIEDEDSEDEIEDSAEPVIEAPVAPTPAPEVAPKPVPAPKPKRAAKAAPKAPSKVAKPKVEKPKAAKPKPFGEVALRPLPTPKPAASTSQVKAETELSFAYQQVLAMHDKGESGRSIEAELRVCRKTISKLIKTYRPAKS